MPEIGEIKRAIEIGFKGYNKFVWVACPDCGKERWVAVKKGKPECVRCQPCSQKGELSNSWKGGRRSNGQGYMYIWVSPDDFFYPMANNNQSILEHRLVMAKHLNRCLLSWEVVHHKGTKYPSGSMENRSDNRLENLELLPTKKYHIIDTLIKAENKRLHDRVDQLEARVILLEAENIILKNEGVMYE